MSEQAEEDKSRIVERRVFLAADAAEGVGLSWVSVAERLPHPDDFVFCVNRFGMHEAWFGHDDVWRLRGHADAAIPDVTHWLPLSAIPLPGQSGAKEGAGLREAREMMHRVRLGIGRLLRDRMPADPSDMRAWAEDLDRGIDAVLRADEEQSHD